MVGERRCACQRGGRRLYQRICFARTKPRRVLARVSILNREWISCKTDHISFLRRALEGDCRPSKCTRKQVCVPFSRFILSRRTDRKTLMKRLFTTLFYSLILGGISVQAENRTVTIAAVNNPDMLELKKLSSKFTETNPGINLQWVIVEENILRQRVTTDVTTGSGQFDLIFLGLYEAPIFSETRCA